MMQRTACITLRVRAKRDLSRCTRTCGSAASVERNGLWREAPNKVRACALWPVAFHRHKAGGDALSCPPVPLKTYRLTNLKLRAMRQTAEGIRQTADGIRSENSREEAQEVTAGDGYELAFQPA